MPAFLVDEDMPRSLAKSLREAGFGAEDVRDAGLRGRSDAEVRAAAVRRGMALVTADLEFANPNVFPDGFPAGLVVCRYPPGTPAAALSRAVVQQIAGLADAELAGSIAVLEPGRVRLHKRSI